MTPLAAQEDMNTYLTLACRAATGFVTCKGVCASLVNASFSVLAESERDSFVKPPSLDCVFDMVDIIRIGFPPDGQGRAEQEMAGSFKLRASRGDPM